MKNKLKRALSLAMVAVLLSAPVTCISAEKVTYSDTQNTGFRDEICLSLDNTGAEDYYAGENSYENLSSLTDAELLVALRSLMTVTHTYKSTYAEARDLAIRTDCEGGNGKIVLLYTSNTVEFSDFIGSGSIGWNREHVWPKSLGGFSNSGAGADLHHVRPDDVTTNAKRGNLKFGNAEGGNAVKGSSLVAGALGGHSKGAYFEPLDNAKGDVARICLYVYVRYGGELPKCSGITNVFESVDVLLDWCESDPVDTWEMGRNEVVEKIQGNRNVFIDYPELAFLLFGREVPEDMTTPSGMALKPEETTAEVTTEEVTTEEVTTEEVTTEEVTTEEVTTEEVTTEEVTTEEVTTEEVTTEEVTTEEVTTEEVTTEEVTTEEITTERVTTEEVTTEKVTTEEPAVTDETATEESTLPVEITTEEIIIPPTDAETAPDLDGGCTSSAPFIGLILIIPICMMFERKKKE